MELQPLHTKIEKTIQTLYGTVVLESPDGFPRAESNLYCISTEGRLIWRAEKPEPSTLYSRVKLNEAGATISTYTLSSHACDIDLGSGKIVSTTSLQ